ncbi:uncharacterized protein N7443_004138 [Penicillium atrosanguineum]|uniref:uncharacterized protein n=1 Tax=Penicillium atrosanguineum TaxID=1132637 RepID=UPI00239D0296|nr:uncharacterized protein N7443_004138 [Penicillium atrosanguineum]KAJ5304478.1 hypothetical protein N7443_004138 [Penicillium atrosanguineum]
MKSQSDSTYFKTRAEDASPDREITVEDIARVRRKMDFYLMPLLILTFLLQCIDKVMLNSVSQIGILEDLHLYTFKYSTSASEPTQNLQRYSNATLIFYWGWLVGLIPTAWMAQKLPIGKYLASTAVIWGAITLLGAAVKNYSGLLAQRFFLGMVECAVGPGFSIMITMFWTRAEQPLRYSLWYTSIGLANLLGSLMLFGIGHIYGKLHLWRYQYLILGAITVVWGIILVILLPQNPATASFLKPEGRVLAVERMRVEQTGIENKQFKSYQIRELVRDPTTWILFATVFCLHFTNGALTGFGSIIINSFEFSHFDSVLLNGAVWGGVLFNCITAGILGAMFKNARLWIVMACEIPVILRACLVSRLDWSTQRGDVIFGFIMCGWMAGGYMMILALVGASVAGHTKKMFMFGILWCAYGLSNGISPLTIKKGKVGQHYPTCFYAIIGNASVTICGALVLRLYLVRENRRRDREFGVVTTMAARELGFKDQTDMVNENFGYSL